MFRSISIWYMHIDLYTCISHELVLCMPSFWPSMSPEHFYNFYECIHYALYKCLSYAFVYHHPTRLVVKCIAHEAIHGPVIECKASLQLFISSMEDAYSFTFQSILSTTILLFTILYVSPLLSEVC